MSSIPFPTPDTQLKLANALANIIQYYSKEGKAPNMQAALKLLVDPGVITYLKTLNELGFLEYKTQ